MIHILLVDDHAILREGLQALLSYYPDVKVVGEARDGAEAIKLVAQLNPDVVLMDIAMPGINGLEATRHIRQEYPGTRVLILTQYEDQPYVLPLLRAGASGYVPKRALGTDLINAIRTVAQGGSFLYPSVATTVIEQLRQPEDGPKKGDKSLTPREQEILSRVAQGHTSQQIAVDLGIGVKTVEWHRGNLLNKLGVRSVAELVHYALKNGLVD